MNVFSRIMPLQTSACRFVKTTVEQKCY